MFDFLKYILPIWNYRLHEDAETRLYSDSELDELEKAGLIAPFPGYINVDSSRMDLVYQALNAGAIPSDKGSGEQVKRMTVKDVHDNYLFIGRHFRFRWSVYILLLRILSLHNPVREWRGFQAGRGLRTDTPSNDELHRGFHSHVTSEELRNSLVSVVIPTLNRYEYLEDVLCDLERQEHGRLEVVVCDQSDRFRPEIYQGRRIPVKVVRQEEKALWKARNTCLEEATGSLILLFDDDSRVEPDWICQHLKCLSYFNAPISAGVTQTVVGHGLSEMDGRFHMSDVFDTGNAMLKREVFERIGLFDRRFEKQRMGDGEYGLRAYLAGYKAISNPYAKRLHMKAESGGLRHFGGWDAFRPGSLFAPRPVPSVLYLSRRYFGDEASLYLVMNALPASTIPYSQKGNRRLKLLVPLLTLLLGPLLCFQTYRSWRISSAMIGKGPLIEFPNMRPRLINGDEKGKGGSNNHSG